jgi:hypothetical protein
MMGVHTVRRLLLAGVVGFSIGLPMLACSGGATTDAATDVAKPEPPDEADPKKRIVGTWRMIPTEDRLRELKIIDAAISGKPQKKEKLGKLSDAEDKLFKEWENKKGEEAKAMKNELKFVKNCLFEFTDSQVTIKFGEDETFGPIGYTVVSATDTNTTLKFDPGLGNGMETHSFDWDGPTKGVDHIKAEDGREFDPLNVSKKNN